MNLISKFKSLLDSCDKNPFMSKTLWINGLTLVAGILALVQGVTSPEWLIPALAGVNIVLRFITTGGITPGNKIVKDIKAVLDKEIENVK